MTDITRSVRDANAEVGARVLELAGREYVLRGRGYVKELKDLEQSVVAVGAGGTPIRLGDVASVRYGPEIPPRGLERHRGGGRRHRGDAHRLECAASHPRLDLRLPLRRFRMASASFPPTTGRN